jgi:hypothetical protein
MFVYLTSAVFIASAFSIVSIVTLLGFITLQYIAICRPLQHMSLVQKRRVLVFIALSWVLTLVSGCVPFFTLLYLSEECTGDILLLIFRVSQIGANCIIVVMFVVYTLILVLCIRIFYEVRQLRKRLSQFRFDQEVQGERRAFFTTLMLIASLTLFYIPFTTVYVYSLNKDGMAIHSSALIYYMTLLPYAKFFIDPLIYGLRMKEIREGCVRFAFHCGCSKCVTMDSIALSRATSVTSTMRMRSFSQKNGQKMQRYVFTSAQGGSVAMT